jgi:voltage-gated sodium channel
MAKREAQMETTQGISEVNASVFPLEVDLASGHQTPEVPERQSSKESSFSVLNIYDPADHIRDDDGQHMLSTRTSNSMAQIMEASRKSVKAWKSRIDGQGFDLLMGVVILANAFVMSIQLEYEGTITASGLGLSADTNDWPSAKSAFFVLQHLFTLIFVFEIIARVFIWGLRYYRSIVNLFDLGIVIISLLDLYVLPWAGVSLPNVTFLRLLRLVMLARVLRMVRVFSVFRHLRVLIHSIISSIGALMWSMLFLSLVHLITSILMTQSLQSWLNDPANDLDTKMFVYNRFGTFFRSCITLFEMTLAPGTWAKIGRVLIYDVNPIYVVFFSIYVPVVTFGITRVMTALFLRETFAAANSDKDMVLEEQIRGKKVQKENLQALFSKIDLDGTGRIKLDELQKALKDPRSATWMQILDVDVYEVVQLFQLLDKDGDGMVTFDEFSKGIMRLRGGAKSIDLISVLRQNAEMSNAIQALGKLVHRMGSGQGSPSRLPVSEQRVIKQSVQPVTCDTSHGIVDL